MSIPGLTVIALHLVAPFFLFIIAITLALATFGKSLGVRRVYVKVLLNLFQRAKRWCITHEKKKTKGSFQVGDDDEDSSEDEGLPDSWSSSRNSTPTFEGQGDQVDSSLRPLGTSDKIGHLDRFVSRHNVISRKDNLILTPGKPAPAPIQEESHKESVADKILSGRVVSVNTFKSEFDLSDVLDYVKTGVACIIEDEVTQRFVAEELKNWNLLTRTGMRFEFINYKVTSLWLAGCIFRYCVLFPGRLAILIVGLWYMAIGMAGVGVLWEGRLKKWLNHHVFTTSFQVLGGALSAVITYHEPENKPAGGICVANHTSPIDVLILACDNAYALIGQRHGGFLGYLQNMLSKASPQIWFERAESKDRVQVFNRLKEHVEDPNKLPILIFPEGTCINNTSVMQFKKGSFEVGGTIYPVAIKYDPQFGDAFWNSSKDGMMTYLMKMMTSWAIVVDVWYLPPMKREEGEDAVKFADRVKKEIALKGGLVDLVWDGNLKRQQVKSEWKAAQQQHFSRRIKAD